MVMPGWAVCYGQMIHNTSVRTSVAVRRQYLASGAIVEAHFLALQVSASVHSVCAIPGRRWLFQEGKQKLNLSTSWHKHKLVLVMSILVRCKVHYHTSGTGVASPMVRYPVQTIDTCWETIVKAACLACLIPRQAWPPVPPDLGMNPEEATSVYPPGYCVFISLHLVSGEDQTC